MPVWLTLHICTNYMYTHIFLAWWQLTLVCKSRKSNEGWLSSRQTRRRLLVGNRRHLLDGLIGLGILGIQPIIPRRWWRKTKINRTACPCKAATYAKAVVRGTSYLPTSSSGWVTRYEHCQLTNQARFGAGRYTPYREGRETEIKAENSVSVTSSASVYMYMLSLLAM